MRTLEVTVSEPTFVALEQAARVRSQPVENVVRMALDAYLQPAPGVYADPQHSHLSSGGAQRRERIHAEAAAWQALPEATRRRYGSDYVAIYQGQVIDHDRDRLALFRRVRAQFGNVPILITPADAATPREFSILSPRLECTR
jgi:hypothetical protein